VAANLALAGNTVFSGHYLLALVQAGASREDAYAWVQECALRSFEEKGADFVKLMAAHPEVRKRLTPARVRELGSLKYQLRAVREIYARAKKNSPTRGPSRSRART
jgi:adenylosuccinate lyase